MTDNMLIKLLKDAISTGLMVSAPFLIVSVVVGLIISIFQATTQIQEQTLTFVPKLIAIAVIGLILSTWVSHTMIELTQRIFQMIPTISR